MPRKREDFGHEADGAGRGGAHPDPGSMGDVSMPELRREAEALGADVVALAEAYSLASRQRAGAFGLSAVWQRICMWDGIWGSQPTRSKPERG